MATPGPKQNKKRTISSPVRGPGGKKLFKVPGAQILTSSEAKAKKIYADKSLMKDLRKKSKGMGKNQFYNM